MSPVGAADLTPPLKPQHGIVDVSAVVGGKVVVKHIGPTELLRIGPITAVLDELRKLSIVDTGDVNVKRPQRHFSRRPFAVGGKAFIAVRAHQEDAAFKASHSCGRAAVGKVDRFGKSCRRCRIGRGTTGFAVLSHVVDAAALGKQPKKQ